MLPPQYAHGAAMLTRQAQSVLAAIRVHIARNGQSPTLKQICSLTGMSLESQVSRLLPALEEHGLITRTPHKRRGIRLLDQPHNCCPNCGHKLGAEAA